MGNKGVVSVEFTLLFGVLVIPVYLTAIDVAPTINTWIDDLRASILQGQIDSIQIRCGDLLNAVNAL